MRRDPLQLRRALLRMASTTGGHFTAAQALMAGYSYPSQSYHVRRGEWTRVDRGIYHLADWPVDRYADLIRVTLASRGLGVVSHDSALAVHDLGDVVPVRTHLTVPAGYRGGPPGVVLHRADLAGGDVEDRAGFRVTSPLRSLVDSAAAGIEGDRLALAIREALDRGMFRERELRLKAAATPAATHRIERALEQAKA